MVMNLDAALSCRDREDRDVQGGCCSCLDFYGVARAHVTADIVGVRMHARLHCICLKVKPCSLAKKTHAPTNCLYTTIIAQYRKEFEFHSHAFTRLLMTYNRR